jgi:phosphoribosyl-AMP cyclohydrolase
VQGPAFPDSAIGPSDLNSTPPNPLVGRSTWLSLVCPGKLYALSVPPSIPFPKVIVVRDSTEPLRVSGVLKWNDEGLIPAIVQDAENGEVLMMAWMDEPALRDTLATGQTHFFSRSRRSHWHKGATSGHVQHVESISIDCDGDVLLIKARQVGGACHEGYRSCFFRRVGDGGNLEVIASPVFDAASIYGPAKG